MSSARWAAKIHRHLALQRRQQRLELRVRAASCPGRPSAWRRTPAPRRTPCGPAPADAHARRRPLARERRLRHLAEVDQHAATGTCSAACSAVRPSVRKTPVCPAITFARPGRGVDDRDAVRPEELQQRLVRVEAVEHAQVGLVRVAQLVLVLVGRDVPRPGQAGRRVNGSIRPGVTSRGGQHRGVRRDRRPRSAGRRR